MTGGETKTYGIVRCRWVSFLVLGLFEAGAIVNERNLYIAKDHEQHDNY